MTELCLRKFSSVWGRKWVTDTGRLQEMWPVRTTERVMIRQTSFQANRNSETAKVQTRIILSWHVR